MSGKETTNRKNSTETSTQIWLNIKANEQTKKKTDAYNYQLIKSLAKYAEASDAQTLTSTRFANKTQIWKININLNKKEVTRERNKDRVSWTLDAVCIQIMYLCVCGF